MLIMMLISIVGLYAMAYYMMQYRTKEVGLRKVNGATIRELLFLLNVDLMKWVVLAYFIACLLVWYFMDYWLNSFVHQIQLGGWNYCFACSLVNSIHFDLENCPFESGGYFKE